MIPNGAFHGAMPTTTPTGSRTITAVSTIWPFFFSVHGKLSPSAAMPRRPMTEPICMPTERVVSPPICAHQALAISGTRFSRMSANFISTLPRSAGGVVGHGPWSNA